MAINWDDSYTGPGNDDGSAYDPGLPSGTAPPPPSPPPPAPPAPPAPQAPTQNPTQPTDDNTSRTLYRWIFYGMNPQEAVRKFNQQYGRTTGNEAVWYAPEAHGGTETVGLPDAYFANKNGAWEYITRGAGGSGGGSGGGGGTGTGSRGIPGLDTSSYNAQFDDPSTKLLEELLSGRIKELNSPLNDANRAKLAALLDQQTAYYQGQRGEQEARNAQYRAKLAQAGQSSEQLLQYLNERVGTLKQPAYTGAEAEVLRTRALEPIEADRQAARQRALNRVSQSGMELDSGIAQELLNQTDAGFDRSRAAAQNDLAYRQITEERSRAQEVQSLLAMIPQIQMASATGDFEFLQAMDDALNRAQLGAITTAGQGAALSQTERDEQQSRRQEAISLASMLQQLPTNAAQQAMAAAGLAGNPESLLQSAIQLFGLGQQQRSQGYSYYEQLGAALPYLMGAFQRGGGTGGAAPFGMQGN